MGLNLNLAFVLFFGAFSTLAQPSSGDANSAFTNHVVIGAFSSHDNAVKFTEKAKLTHPDVKFDMNPDRQLYYVYVLNTTNRVQAFAEARKLRKESRYWDSWVYYGVLGEAATAAADGQGIKRNALVASSGEVEVKTDSKNVEKEAAEVKAYSMADEPAGMDVEKMISGASSEQQKAHYQTIQDVRKSATRLDADTKVIVFKDDEEGRKALRSLGYDIDEDQPVTGFFDSNNNILAINASETQADQPFHEGLKPVVKFLRKKDPESFDAFAAKALAFNHPTRGVAYKEINATGEEALANVLADAAKGYFEANDQKDEVSELMKEILVSLGVKSPEIAVSDTFVKTTAGNLAVAVREATGFDAEGNRKFRFNIFNTVNNKKIKGEVDLVNDAGRKLMSYPGNELVTVGRADASGNIVLACEVLGYRKLLFKVNYDNPFLTERVKRGDDDEAILDFGLVRLQKGDIAVMYNVYFFKDAAIMRPESRYELNNLLDMMRENDAYKIRIHGHTNGNAAGKIITMGDSKSYFSLSDTKEGRGSAKKLSEERAEVIKGYLENEGVNADRMEIRAWGGKRPLYDKNHSLAQSNVRVEIEIIEN